MNKRISPLQIINLPNRSTLTNLMKGKNLHWVFMPGGPGLGDNYLKDFLTVDKFLDGTISTYQFPDYSSHESDEKIFRNIQEDIMFLIENFNNVVLVGHSFSGMLLQTLTLDERKYNKIILLCSSPDLECFKIATTSFDNFLTQEKEKINEAQMLYEKTKSNETFKNLFKSWGPYYVSQNFHIPFDAMIEHSNIDYNFHEWGNRFFYNYFDLNKKIAPKTMIINAERDKICPSSLFNKCHDSIEKIVLNSSSHFPWLENNLIREVLRRIESQIT